MGMLSEVTGVSQPLHALQLQKARERHKTLNIATIFFFIRNSFERTVRLAHSVNIFKRIFILAHAREECNLNLKKYAIKFIK